MRAHHALVPGIVALFAAVQSAPALAQAQYPSRPIHLVVPFPAGGSSDLLGRALAKKMSEGLAQQVVVENRAGAGGTNLQGLPRYVSDHRKQDHGV